MDVWGRRARIRRELSTSARSSPCKRSVARLEQGPRALSGRTCAGSRRPGWEGPLKKLTAGIQDEHPARIQRHARTKSNQYVEGESLAGKDSLESSSTRSSEPVPPDFTPGLPWSLCTGPLAEVFPELAARLRPEDGPVSGAVCVDPSRAPRRFFARSAR